MPRFEWTTVTPEYGPLKSPVFLALDVNRVGDVTERVLEHEPRRIHRVEFRDPEAEGELETRFAIEGGGTLVSQELDYRLRSGGPLAQLTDRLFIRSQMRGSLARSLDRLKLEVEELAAAGPQPL